MSTLYGAVKHHVLSVIEDKSYGAGDKLPSESALVKKLGVSRMTVNRALRELTKEGHIIRRAGMGSFVASRRMRGSAADIISIRAELASRSEIWSASVLLREEVVPPVAVHEAFGSPSTATAFHVMILHEGNGLPIELEDRWVSTLIAPGMLAQDYSVLTTTEYLLAVAPLLRAEHVVRAVVPSEEQAALLNISPVTPCLEISRTTWTGDKVASFARLLYPGDRYELTAKFSNVGANARAE
ncbi:MAG: histidine utilization repressor [Kordiimonadales bacterium]|nr:MAG: histidine utilization repressor [Kordiimonadales bacterium]